MATIKVFHRLDAPADGSIDVSRHVSISELVDEYKFVGRTSFQLSMSDYSGEYHPAEAFEEAINRFTFGPGATSQFTSSKTRSLLPGDVLIRTDTGESVIIEKDGYAVLDLKGVKARTNLDSEGKTTEPKTWPDYAPDSNESFDKGKHTYDREESDVSEEETEGLGDLFE